MFLASLKVAFHTLGCKVNYYETEALKGAFRREGFELVDFQERADVYVINTCTVTHLADRKSRQAVRRAKKRNPAAIVAVTGCYPQVNPGELTSLPEVDIISGTGERLSLPEIVKRKLEGEDIAPLVTPYGQAAIFEDLPWVPEQERTRAFLKIQDGCDDFCSFCIVPYVRGRERSLPPEQVLIEVKSRAAAGYKEVVLTGTKVGSYKQDGGLPGLIKRILRETGVERLRLSSLQPQELTPGLLGLWKDPRLCRHLHIPLQSGSDAVLQGMRRRYSLSDYERAVSLVRAIIPEVAIITDIIVGFPSESEEDFEESCRFCEQMKFANIHVFPYSARSGTLAARMPNPVKEEVKRKRLQRMLELAQRSAQRFGTQFLGQTMSVLWERKTEEGLWSGLTDNYLRVFTRSNEPLTNRLVPTKLIAEYGRGLWGEVIKEARDG